MPTGGEDVESSQAKESQAVPESTADQSNDSEVQVLENDVIPASVTVKIEVALYVAPEAPKGAKDMGDRDPVNTNFQVYCLNIHL